jgi:two-component system chemotaxis sensor kinase CheA
VGEVILTTTQLRTAADDAAGQGPTEAKLTRGFDHMDRVVGELKRRALELRTTPLLRIMENLPRLAREVALRGGKLVEVEVSGTELELDRSILDRLYDPLVHLVRNAVDHGLETPAIRRASGKPETGRLIVEAAREKDLIRIIVRDDGAGIDLAAVCSRAVAAGLVHPDLAEDLPPDEILRLVFRPGLSTKDVVSDISGRGVGMDAVRATLESLGGEVRLASHPGAGTEVSLRVPIAAAVQRVLLLGLGREMVALPIAKMERIIEVDASSIERSGGDDFALVDGEPVLVIDLVSRLAWADPLPPGAPVDAAPVLLLLADVRGERVALRVDHLAGQQDIYVKPPPLLLGSLRALTGLTVLGDGRPVFLIDLNQVR